jgi:hypothetical protein
VCVAVCWSVLQCVISGDSANSRDCYPPRPECVAVVMVFYLFLCLIWLSVIDNVSGENVTDVSCSSISPEENIAVCVCVCVCVCVSVCECV